MYRVRSTSKEVLMRQLTFSIAILALAALVASFAPRGGTQADLSSVDTTAITLAGPALPVAPAADPF
jgi:hypothetical protein